MYIGGDDEKEKPFAIGNVIWQGINHGAEQRGRVMLNCEDIFWDPGSNLRDPTLNALLSAWSVPDTTKGIKDSSLYETNKSDSSGTHISII